MEQKHIGKKLLAIILGAILLVFSYILETQECILKTKMITHKHKQYGEVHYFPRCIINPFKANKINRSIASYIDANFDNINAKAEFIKKETCCDFELLSIKKEKEAKHVLIRFKQSKLQNDLLVFKLDKNNKILEYY